MAPRDVKIISGDEPVAAHIFEHAILELAQGMKKLSATRLKRDTIILLLHDATGIGKRDIGYVLNAMEQLETTYLKPKTPLSKRELEELGVK